jgi:CBS domain-containing protein
LAAAIFFDLRPIAWPAGGREALGASLRAVIQEEAPGARRFLGLLAREVVDRAVPLTVFGNVRVARSGPASGTVDLKGGGTLQLVGAARVHALALGLAETNTVDRFRAAAAHGLVEDGECRAIIDAYQHLQRLRLLHQLGCLARGAPPDNRVDPRGLSRADALLLRDALGTVARVQTALRERYATDFIL